jgi:NAD(P)H-dependent FMN reductase
MIKILALSGSSRHGSLNQKLLDQAVQTISALPPRADIIRHGFDIRFTPESGHHSARL